ncbi:MAG: hypothetical protein Fur0010_28410 [Bdellovibrio sp.]
MESQIIDHHIKSMKLDILKFEKSTTVTKSKKLHKEEIGQIKTRLEIIGLGLEFQIQQNNRR